MLYLISLGLYDKKDISLRALETIKKCDVVYFESYTHVYASSAKELSELFGKEVKTLKREDVENKSKLLIDEAKVKDVALLVGGDCLVATTHLTLFIEAKENNVKVKFIHGSSILTAISEIGLSLYKFGKVTSIPFENQEIEAPYEVLAENQSIKAHTLFLLDLNPEGNKFLKINDAINYLFKVELKCNLKIFSKDAICIGCARLGSKNQITKVALAKDMLNFDFGEGPFCLIVPSRLNFIEEEALSFIR